MSGTEFHPSPRGLIDRFQRSRRPTPIFIGLLAVVGLSGVFRAPCRMLAASVTRRRRPIGAHGPLMSSLTRSGAEMLARVEEWHRAMLEKGWK